MCDALFLERVALSTNGGSAGTSSHEDVEQDQTGEGKYSGKAKHPAYPKGTLYGAA